MPIIDHSRAPEVPWRPNYRVWSLAGAEQGMSSTLTYSEGQAGTGAPLHRHQEDELIVVLEGTLEVRVGGEVHTAGPDHTVAVPPGVDHGFTVKGPGPARLLTFFPSLDPFSRTTYLEGAPAGNP